MGLSECQKHFYFLTNNYHFLLFNIFTAKVFFSIDLNFESLMINYLFLSKFKDDLRRKQAEVEIKDLISSDTINFGMVLLNQYLLIPCVFGVGVFDLKTNTLESLLLSQEKESFSSCHLLVGK